MGKNTHTYTHSCLDILIQRNNSTGEGRVKKKKNKKPVHQGIRLNATTSHPDKIIHTHVSTKLTVIIIYNIMDRYAYIFR